MNFVLRKHKTERGRSPSAAARRFGVRPRCRTLRTRDRPRSTFSSGTCLVPIDPSLLKQCPLGEAVDVSAERGALVGLGGYFIPVIRRAEDLLPDYVSPADEPEN